MNQQDLELIVLTFESALNAIGIIEYDSTFDSGYIPGTPSSSGPVPLLDKSNPDIGRNISIKDGTLQYCTKTATPTETSKWQLVNDSDLVKLVMDLEAKSPAEIYKRPQKHDEIKNLFNLYPDLSTTLIPFDPASAMNYPQYQLIVTTKPSPIVWKKISLRNKLPIIWQSLDKKELEQFIKDQSLRPSYPEIDPMMKLGVQIVGFTVVALLLSCLLFKPTGSLNPNDSANIKTIAENSGRIVGNTGEEGAIAKKLTTIEGNTGEKGALQKLEQIRINTGAIATNTKAIATNTKAIVTNTGTIATNTNGLSSTLSAILGELQKWVTLPPTPTPTK